MKKILLLFLGTTIISISSYLIFQTKKKPVSDQGPIPQKNEFQISPPVSPYPEKSITYENNIYVYYEYHNDNPYHISLIPNFRKQSLAAEVFASGSCRALINGGFYDTENRPLGLFRIEDMVYSPRKESRLFDGFISYHDETGLQIDFSGTEEPNTWVMQTGPMLIYDSKPIRLTITDDEPARRSVMANADGSAVMMIITLEGQNKSGPLLSDLPEILSEINRKENLDIINAVNLDGGSASAFITEEVILQEISPVGSFLCIK